MPEIANQQIRDDAALMRSRIAAPSDRRFALVVKRDHIRVVYDDDVELTNAQVFRVMDEMGYRAIGANLGTKTLVFEPRDN